MSGRGQNHQTSVQAKLSYRREAFRRKITIRRLAIGVLVNLLVVLLIGSYVLLHFEKAHNPKVNTYGDAVWLSVVTISTVGYGDSYPVTTGGKLTIVVMLISGAALLSAFISQRSQRIEKERRKKVSGLEDKIKSRSHYVVCGWNQRAPFLLDKLKEELKPERIAIVHLCDLEDRPEDDDYVFFLRGRPTSEVDLKRANIEEAEAAILLADMEENSERSDVDARTVLTALTIRSLNPDIKMTAEVLFPENVHHLELAGVGEILDTNLFLGSLLARSVRRYGLIGIVTELVTKLDRGINFRIPVTPEMQAMTGPELRNHIKESYKANLVAVTSATGMTFYRDGMKLSTDDILLISAAVRPPDAL